MDWFDLLAVQGTLKSLFQHHSSKASVLPCSAITLYRWILLFSFYRWEYMVRPYNSAEGKSWDLNPSSLILSPASQPLHYITSLTQWETQTLPPLPLTQKLGGSTKDPPVFLSVTSCSDFLPLLNSFSPQCSFKHFFLIFHSVSIRVIHPYSLESQIQTFTSIDLFGCTAS